MAGKQNPNAGKFPDSLPEVSSPEHLDRGILAESRRLAPERTGRFILSGWVPMAATAATIAVAFVIARPLLIEVDHAPAPQSATMEEQATLKSRSETMDVQLASPQALSQDATPVKDEAKKSKIERAAPANEPQDFVLPTRLQGESASAVVMDQAVEAEIASDEPMAVSSKKQDADAEIVLGEQQLAEAIDDIEALLEAGEIEQARERLELLRMQCPACDIPDSLRDL